MKAVDLRAGDRLQLVNGEYVTVEQVQHEILESPITVYNFRVADNHNYYVGTDNEAVLVHNEGCFKYEKASYHSKGNKVKSAAPKNGQIALDNSFPIKGVLIKAGKVNKKGENQKMSFFELKINNTASFVFDWYPRFTEDSVNVCIKYDYKKADTCCQ